jgi:DNA-binding winged helix-turn-helix (wHTH) protein
MTVQRYCFTDFVLDPHERQLSRNGQRLELNARYLDALVLLVQDAGKLVSKERFFNEVWQGLVVSDEALTQCIRTLRRVLQDSAATPVFIETVPKHGYRFIAQVSVEVPESTASEHRATNAVVQSNSLSQALWHMTGQGVMGAALAGMAGGALYGVSAVLAGLVSGQQLLSVLLVFLSITTLIAILAGAALSVSLSAVSLWRRSFWLLLLAGGVAGAAIGAFVSVLLQETLVLFFGRSPNQITGAAEGWLVGLAAGLSCWLVSTTESKIRFFYAAAPGVLAGLVLSVTGGVLLAGSLIQLVAEFPQSGAAALAELYVGDAAARQSPWLVLSAMLESSLFIAGLTLGLARARRSFKASGH